MEMTYASEKWGRMAGKNNDRHIKRKNKRNNSGCTDVN